MMVLAELYGHATQASAACLRYQPQRSQLLRGRASQRPRPLVTKCDDMAIDFASRRDITYAEL